MKLVRERNARVKTRGATFAGVCVALTALCVLAWWLAPAWVLVALAGALGERDGLSLQLDHGRAGGLADHLGQDIVE